MDPLGNVVRELLKQARAQRVKNATSLAGEFRKEGMTDSQIEEMLFASGFDDDVVDDAMKEISPKRGSGGTDEVV